MIGLGPNIGSTIFLLVGLGVGIAGPALILVLILNFLVTTLTALSYMELSSAFPETGGGYLWVREGLFPPLGFLGGWMSWVGHCIACAVYVLGFGEGITWLMAQYNITVPGIGADMLIKIFAVVIAAVFSWLNYRGVRGTGRSQVYVSFVLVGMVVLYILFALHSILTTGPAPQSFEPFMPFGLMSLAGAMGFTFMIFEGYEIVAQTGEEAKNAEKVVPKAMFLCIFISAVIFVIITALTIAVSGWPSVADWGTEALARTSEQVVPIMGPGLIAIGVIIGSLAAINSVVFSTSRVSFAMGRDGTLPESFGKLHPRNMTPSTAIIFSGVIIVIMSVFMPIEQVAMVADILILLLFVLVNWAAINMRKLRPDANREFVTPFFPWIPIAGIITQLFLAIAIFDIEPLSWYVAIGAIYVGLVIHYFSGAREEIERIELPEREPMDEETKERYRVMIPIDDPSNIRSLQDLGAIIANNRDGELLLHTVIEVPTSAPLDAVDKDLIQQKKRMLEKVKLQADLKGIKTRALVSVSHDIARAIVDTAKDEGVNMILLGWKGYAESKKDVLGRKMDEILRKAPCDVIVLKSEGRLSPESITILSGGMWHVSKATEVASEIALSSGGRITIMNVIVKEDHFDRAREYSQRLESIVKSYDVPVITREVRSKSIVDGAISYSTDTDLLALGVSGARRWDKFVLGPMQDRITKGVRCPVLIYKRVATPESEQPGTNLTEIELGE